MCHMQTQALQKNPLFNHLIGTSHKRTFDEAINLCRLPCISCIKPINETASFEFIDERWISDVGFLQ